MTEAEKHYLKHIKGQTRRLVKARLGKLKPQTAEEWQAEFEEYRKQTKAK